MYSFDDMHVLFYTHFTCRKVAYIAATIVADNLPMSQLGKNEKMDSIYPKISLLFRKR